MQQGAIKLHSVVACTKRHKEAQRGTKRPRGLWKGKRNKNRQKRWRERGKEEEEGEKESIKRLFVMGA